MNLPKRYATTLAASASLMACAVAAPLFGQDNGKTTAAAKIELSAEELAKVESTAKRMPAYFGQIALTLEQRAKIVEIQRGRVRRLAELQKEIAAVKKEILSESETVLTPAQKELLDHLRRAKAEQSKKSAASAPSSKDGDAKKDPL